MDRSINNEIYDLLGDRWYQAFDDPVALLRAESKLIAPWIVDTARKKMAKPPKDAVDLGCGGGFISNQLALSGLNTIAFDLSKSSLEVASSHDQTRSVDYRIGDVTAVPLDGSTCDLVTCCDVLEHVPSPNKIVQEAFRLLRPGGMFFFHTFSRNPLSYLVVIKAVEWLVRNTPKDLHVYSMFITPQELERFSADAGFIGFETIGIRPSLRSLMDPSIFRRTVPRSLRFKFSNSRSISYAGFAMKPK